MENNLDNFVQQLQDQIFEETKKDFGEKVYKRWREPLYMGVIDEPDGHAKVKGKCVDSIEIFLKFEKYRILTHCRLKWFSYYIPIGPYH